MKSIKIKDDSIMFITAIHLITLDTIKLPEYHMAAISLDIYKKIIAGKLE